MRYLFALKDDLHLSQSKIREHIGKLRERGMFCKAETLFFEIALHVPEFTKYISKSHGVTGRTTLIIDVLGVIDAWIIKHIFEVFHSACTGSLPFVWEFGFTQIT